MENMKIFILTKERCSSEDAVCFSAKPAAEYIRVFVQHVLTKISRFTHMSHMIMICTFGYLISAYFEIIRKKDELSGKLKKIECLKNARNSKIEKLQAWFD
jgi:hypothetical protein